VIFHAALAIYAACVDFMLITARMLGVTYRDTNALMFFVVWPIITVALIAIVLVQWRTERAERARKVRTTSA
jgi:hypothetical protein